MFDVVPYVSAIRWAATRSTPGRVRRRLLGTLLVGVPALEGVVRAGRAADHLLAPGHRQVEIQAPVFIVGHARSGTTWLHRLLALDEEQFATGRVWELLLPALSLMRGVRWLSAHYPDPMQAAAKSLESRLFDSMRAIHDTSWHAAEEDSLLFAHGFGGQHIATAIPDPALFAHTFCLDGLSDPERRRWLRWYVHSVRRLLYDQPGKTWLSKSPLFTGWISTLSQTFPDARFIMLMREPAEAIASFLDMRWKAAYRMMPEVRRTGPEMRALFLSACQVYRHAEAHWDEIPEGQRLRVRYRALLRDPAAMVQQIYAHFGLSRSPRFDAAVADAIRHRHVPRSVPSLRSFGITSSDLARELGDEDTLWRSLRSRPPRVAQ